MRQCRCTVVTTLRCYCRMPRFNPIVRLGQETKCTLNCTHAAANNRAISLKCCSHRMRNSICLINVAGRPGSREWFFNTVSSSKIKFYRVTWYVAFHPTSWNRAADCWRRGSVVTMSVCSRRTFPDLRLIHGWRVTTLWVKASAMGQPTRPTQPSIPPGSVNE